MKRIILAAIVAFSFFAAGAQTTKSKKKSKKTYVSSETKAKAREKAELARIQLETDKKILEFKTASLQADSMRLDSERIARENFEVQRTVYMETRLKEIDSTNKATWKKFSEDKEQWSKTDQRMDAINKAAKLNSYESRQVKTINQSFDDKAKVVNENTEILADQKKQQLISFNTERRSRIKAIVGKSKEKKLEKERKDYVKKYGQDNQAKWIDEVERYAKN